MKIGILGGTFNPIHNSHLYLAEAFREALGLDKLLLIPTNTPPHKSARGLAPAADRLAMCRLAAEGRAYLEVSDYEAGRGEPSYTYRTLEYLRSVYPGDTLYFLMGADMFLTILEWRNPERIIGSAVLCAAARQPGELPALEAQQKRLEPLGARCRVLTLPPKPLSSTQVREAVMAGKSIANMVPAAVADYIKTHGLYKAEGM